MATNEDKTLTIEGARLVYRNFSGNPTQFVPEGGKRTFAVVLDKETADMMVADGWNVKCKPAHVDQDEGTDEFCFIEVTVGFKFRPPRIFMITESNNSRTMLGEDLVGILDGVEFKNVDLVIRSRYWEVGGKSGEKAYLQSMFAIIEEDELERKYADIPMGGE